MLVRMKEKRYYDTLLVGMQASITTMAKSMESPQNPKNRPAYDLAVLLLGTYLK
jgi:hypothetical protein